MIALLRRTLAADPVAERHRPRRRIQHIDRIVAPGAAEIVHLRPRRRLVALPHLDHQARRIHRRPRQGEGGIARARRGAQRLVVLRRLRDDPHRIHRQIAKRQCRRISAAQRQPHHHPVRRHIDRQLRRHASGAGEHRIAAIGGRRRGQQRGVTRQPQQRHARRCARHSTCRPEPRAGSAAPSPARPASPPPSSASVSAIGRLIERLKPGMSSTGANPIDSAVP